MPEGLFSLLICELSQEGVGNNALISCLPGIYMDLRKLMYVVHLGAPEVQNLFPALLLLYLFP